MRKSKLKSIAARTAFCTLEALAGSIGGAIAYGKVYPYEPEKYISASAEHRDDFRYAFIKDAYDIGMYNLSKKKQPYYAGIGMLVGVGVGEGVLALAHRKKKKK